MPGRAVDQVEPPKLSIQSQQAPAWELGNGSKRLTWPSFLFAEDRGERKGNCD